MTIDPKDAALLDAGEARAENLSVLHRSGNADARLLQHLIGRWCVKDDRLYEITAINYGYCGFITAKGYRILDDGKRGSKVWDLGSITSKLFQGIEERTSNDHHQHA